MDQEKKKIDEIIDIVKQWATTGENTDECLKQGFLPMPVHFYQPIPDIDDLEKRGVWDRKSNMKGIKFTPKKYLDLLGNFSSKYADECKWPNEPTEDSDDFFLNNSCFSYGCATVLHCMIRDNKPKKIIEIGSGFSSKIIRDAIFVNAKESSAKTEYTIVDPYTQYSPDELGDVNIVKEGIETLDEDIFTSLQENDILFIDSSHVCKIGSDVNFEILDILPILKKGVIVHFHDIDLPYEYSKTYATNPAFRMFWTEAYLLQAFLSCNTDFEIVLPMRYMQKDHEQDFRRLFPHSSDVCNFESGSFWIRRIADYSSKKQSDNEEKK